MKLAIIRTANGPLDINKYNIQEIGLAKALIKRGISVDIYSTYKGISGFSNIEKFDGNELNLIEIKGFAFKQITYYPSLFKKVFSKEYDLIQIHDDSQLMNPFLVSKAKKKGIKTVLYQGMYKDYKGLGFVYQTLFNSLLYQKLKINSDVVFAKTTLAQKYLNNKGIKNTNLLPVGLDLKPQAQNFSKRNELLNFKSQFNHLLLYVGVLEPRRDVVFLLKILKHLKEKKTDLSVGMVIVGNGPDKEKIKKIIIEFNLSEYVLYFESIPNSEMSYIYKQCDLFLLPSAYEIYGMVVLESLYNGIPVLSSRVAGPIDMLKQDFLGKVIEINFDNWLEYIYKFLNSDFVIKAKYSKSRESYILNNFTWDNLAKTYIDKIT